MKAMRLNAVKLLLLALLAALSCALVPAVAAAATFQVDSTGDQTDSTPGDGLCRTALSTCTLRAAIEESNAEPTADAIDFAPTFDGRPGSVISLVASLPTISQPLSIEGDASGRCTGPAGVGPCVGIAGVESEPILTVNTAHAAIAGLAILGASAGIELTGNAENVEVRDNWI